MNDNDVMDRMTLSVISMPDVPLVETLPHRSSRGALSGPEVHGACSRR